MNLKSLGWNETFEEAFNEYKGQKLVPGRISVEHKGLYDVLTEEGELLGEITGKIRYNAKGRHDYPAVGDWVAVQAVPQEGKAYIHGVLPRKSKFSRKAAGATTEEQIVATNVDTVFLVNALNQDFNLRRLERYLLMAWESGATPVIVLSKADLCENVQSFIDEVETIAFGVPTFAVSVESGTGLDKLLSFIKEGETVALLGSSGVGKSTLANYLFGQEVLKTKDIREDDGKGKHTTTHRELLVLENGGILIDTPGMRELQLWEGDSSINQSFQDIEAFAEQCRFRDCTHQNEPGCQVQAAIENGDLKEDRYASYVKLQRELAFFARKEDQKLALAEKARWKKLAGDRTRVHRK
ncbi:ribosome small subunit-dependent GTPase A [Fictibacillus nanhaiensis]|uniref:ribosome small subunit-dependent GTPase A n=1 Tax=Fictibacillus nanhaiensis TaxID=742169 RepID=UPI001C954D1D|nr:ribosome small subunit-dependent GTPase A [Fictibacillus nanhaiensis]MBY6038099.1 ribosome small subunit-dependent GTPase A [Fictibacillus nanhaiensis]